MAKSITVDRVVPRSARGQKVRVNTAPGRIVFVEKNELRSSSRRCICV